MKDWQRTHLKNKMDIINASTEYDILINSYAEYFYSANVELYAVNKAVGEKKFVIHKINELINIMATDDIFKTDLQTEVFDKSSCMVNGRIDRKLEIDYTLKILAYRDHPYFVSMKNPSYKIYWKDIDERMQVIYSNNIKHNVVYITIGFVAALSLLGGLLWQIM